METQEAIKSRRSIRRYQATEVDDKTINLVLEAARQAPSWDNTQCWQFIVVRDAGNRNELADMLPRTNSAAKGIREAPVVIVCFGDLNASSRENRYKRVQELYNLGIRRSGRISEPEYWEERFAAPPTPRQEVVTHTVLSSAIGIEHLVLMATALGLGTCWCWAVDFPELNRLFDLPDNLVSITAIPVGYAKGERPPEIPRLGIDEILLKTYC